MNATQPTATSNTHTPEPWMVNGSDMINSVADGKVRRVADCEWTPYDQRPKAPIAEDMANAARIVACVNACAGINPDAVPDILAALIAALPYVEEAERDDAYKPGAVARISRAMRDALAKATSE